MEEESTISIGVATDLAARPVNPVPLDTRALLHPSEHSRLLIALSASAVVFGVVAMVAYATSGWTALAVAAVAVAVFGGLVWLSLQVYRSRLLGGAVRVSEATLPELQSIFDEVRARLDYDEPVDVYVMDKVDGGSDMTSYLGTRLIRIEGVRRCRDCPACGATGQRNRQDLPGHLHGQ